jgi:hypothetical protein
MSFMRGGLNWKRKKADRGKRWACVGQVNKLVEAAGVELFRVLIPRNLLILGTATTAKTAPLPDPLYVYCTKMFFALEFR